MEDKYREYLFMRLECYGRIRENLLNSINRGVEVYQDESSDSYPLRLLLKMVDYGSFEVYLDINRYADI